MGDQPADRSRVELILNDGLVRQVLGLTGDLSETVERLLTRFVEEATRRDAERQTAIERHMAASNAFTATYGTLADEFSAL